MARLIARRRYAFDSRRIRRAGCVESADGGASGTRAGDAIGAASGASIGGAIGGKSRRSITRVRITRVGAESSSARSVEAFIARPVALDERGDEEGVCGV